ncbi:MAG: lytic murein transglycosylase [Patescibacteria group bacterium]|nr:lytic murein transglycosylase [Patescibacteria group bacterium]
MAYTEEHARAENLGLATGLGIIGLVILLGIVWGVGSLYAASQEWKHSFKTPTRQQTAAPRIAIAPPASTATSAFQDSRCIGNPWSQPAADAFGVPEPLLGCMHYAETRCGTGGLVEGGYQAVTAVKNLPRPVTNAQALAKIATHIGVPIEDMRSNRVGAMGPFQFVPATWLAYAADGDRDGIASPYDLADATFTTANHLAQAHAKRGNWAKVLHGWNRSHSPQVKKNIRNILACAGL